MVFDEKSVGVWCMLGMIDWVGMGWGGIDGGCWVLRYGRVYLSRQSD